MPNYQSKDDVSTVHGLFFHANSDGSQTPSVNTEGQKATFSAVSTGLVPAASATDIWTLAGSATKTIRLLRLTLSGTAGTLITVPAYLARRLVADTGGTPATSLALPVAVPHDTADAQSVATAVLNAYTANPTINDSSPKLLRAATVTLGTTAAETVAGAIVWDFTTRNGKAPVLRGAAQQFVLNLSGTSITSGLLNIDAEWTEE